ncbi:MAG TPA: MBL fold metallo-hydrolase [Actinomycetota bacterium]|nr:MBL fold metallo-hydrolase [Actinomycetota bacterium]
MHEGRPVGELAMAEALELPARGDPQFDTGELKFIGNATVLVTYGGFTFLTDPNFLHQGEHAKLGYGLRSERLMEPAMTIDQLPPLDFVVLSHHHGDHFDEVAARDLDKDVPIITNQHAARKLGRQGFRNAIALETWESQWIHRPGSRVRITSMPGKHAPQPLQAALPPVMGSMLEFFRGQRVTYRMYITGDTLLHDRLEQIPKRYPDIDLALIHLGGTRIAGILLTMDAEQGVRCLQIVAPKTAVPIHYNDYTVMKDPLSAFKLKAEEASLPTEIRFVSHGDVLELVSERAKQLAT